MLNVKPNIFSVILVSIVMFCPLSASATMFDMTFNVTGGTSQGINGTPGSFSGSFNIPTFIGAGLETFTGSAQIQNFSVTFNNIWDAGANTNQTDTFTTPAIDGNFTASFNNGALTNFDYLSNQFVPLDLFINFPGAINPGAVDWSLVTDSDNNDALLGTLSVQARTTPPPPTPAPAPATLLLIIMGLGSLALMRRRHTI